MSETFSRVIPVDAMPEPQGLPASLAGARPATGEMVVSNEDLLRAIKSGRRIARDLQHNSVDYQDPMLALRAHEILDVGKTILERLLIAQGGQESLDELNRSEQAAAPSGVRAVLPHH